MKITGLSEGRTGLFHRCDDHTRIAIIEEDDQHLGSHKEVAHGEVSAGLAVGYKKIRYNTHECRLWGYPLPDVQMDNGWWTFNTYQTSLTYRDQIVWTHCEDSPK